MPGAQEVPEVWSECHEPRALHVQTVVSNRSLHKLANPNFRDIGRRGARAIACCQSPPSTPAATYVYVIGDLSECRGRAGTHARPCTVTCVSSPNMNAILILTTQ